MKLARLAMVSALTAAFLGIAVTAQTNRKDNDDMIEQVSTFTAAGPHGARLSLSDVTNFEWDTVHAFSGTMPIELYRAEFGPSFRLDDDTRAQLSDDSSVLIFLRNDEVVRQVVVGPPVFMAGLTGRSRGRSEAELIVVTADPGPYSTIAFAD